MKPDRASWAYFSASTSWRHLTISINCWHLSRNTALGCSSNFSPYNFSASWMVSSKLPSNINWRSSVWWWMYLLAYLYSSELVSFAMPWIVLDQVHMCCWSCSMCLHSHNATSSFEWLTPHPPHAHGNSSRPWSSSLDAPIRPFNSGKKILFHLPVSCLRCRIWRVSDRSLHKPFLLDYAGWW